MGTINNILIIVEDDSVQLEELAATFRNGYEIYKAADGQEALDTISKLALDSKMPAVIISDNNMPIMTGIELLMILREDECYGRIPFILTSGLPSPELLKQIMDKNGHFLSKPFNIKKMIELVAELSQNVPA